MVAGAIDDDGREPVRAQAPRTETAKLTASDAGFRDFLGSSVAVQGETILAGATGEGAAYVLSRVLMVRMWRWRRSVSRR